MEHRAYFIVGDFFSCIVTGGMTGWLVTGWVGSGWSMFGGMLLGMGVGMGLAFLLSPIFMTFFGAMEVMVPGMLSGMLGGMVVGMGVPGDSLTALDGWIQGGVAGGVVVMATYAMNWQVKGVRP
ncbi:MAG: hypothetical protein HQL52_02990 [Magnetococcales bacterium]|nr:hypothetical protein [Magnetococcales bacterium]